jgi:hypothetical protein
VTKLGRELSVAMMTANSSVIDSSAKNLPDKLAGWWA